MLVAYPEFCLVCKFLLNTPAVDHAQYNRTTLTSTFDIGVDFTFFFSFLLQALPQPVILSVQCKLNHLKNDQ